MTNIEEKLVDEMQSLMEGHVDSVIGEDGLTVFDFAELRDAFVAFHMKSLAQQRAEMVKEIREKMTDINEDWNNMLTKGLTQEEIYEAIKENISLTSSPSISGTEIDCMCHCHEIKGIYCKCIKNCIHCHPENFPEKKNISMSDICSVCGKTAQSFIDEYEKDRNAEDILQHLNKHAAEKGNTT